MLITFVRHGESISNTSKQGAESDEGLSKLGKKQAEQMKNIFTRNPFAVLISSPLNRALQTARIIHQEPEKIIIDERLREIKKPSALINLQNTDSEFKAIKQSLLMHGHKKDWRHSDEESFYTFLDRIRDFLFSQTQDNVLAITHSGVMRMILVIATQPATDHQITIKSYLDSRNKVSIENGMIIKVKKTEARIELAAVENLNFRI